MEALSEDQKPCFMEGNNNMVKKLEFEGSIEFASPETVFKFLYEDDAFIKFYHKEVSDDNNASASSWSEEDGSRRREVTFKPRVTNVPFLFRRLLGGDIARLTDVQHCTRNGNAFTIHSELSTAVFSGSTLVTHGDTILSPAEKGCGIVVYLTLELQTRLWGLQGRVEMYAEREARAVFKRWLNIARVFCEEKYGLEEEPLLEEEASSEDEDSFYDAEDLAQEDVISTEEELNIIDVISTEEELNIIPVTGLPTTPTTPSLRHSESRFQDWFVQEVWRSYCISVQNHAKLQKIEREIFLLNSSWTAFGLGIATGLGLVFLYKRQLNRQK